MKDIKDFHKINSDEDFKITTIIQEIDIMLKCLKHKTEKLYYLDNKNNINWYWFKETVKILGDNAYDLYLNLEDLLEGVELKDMINDKEMKEGNNMENKYEVVFFNYLIESKDKNSNFIKYGSYSDDYKVKNLANSQYMVFTSDNGKYTYNLNLKYAWFGDYGIIETSLPKEVGVYDIENKKYVKVTLEEFKKLFDSTVG